MATASPPPTEPIEYALRYAGVGLRVVPIKPGHKRPELPAWQRAATTDRATIESWWHGLYRGHGVGLALGELEDYATATTWIFAVDVDQHGVDGGAMLAELEAHHGELPTTVEATTGGGGRHLLFSADHEIRNGKLCDGVDIRGAGGQIVVEPSIHPSGQPYHWVIDQAPWEHPIAPAPAWLLDRLTAVPEAPPRTPAAPTVAADAGSRPGDLWAAETSWYDLLTADGWTHAGRGGSGEEQWVRPGKTVRDGISATVGYGGSDVLKVFTTSHPQLNAEETYTKLGYLAATRHGGDHGAAARALRAEGWHTPDEHIDVAGMIATSGAGGSGSPEPWPELLPLEDQPALPLWPVYVLPDWIAEHVTTTADQLQVPVDLCAQFALGALATVAMGYAEVVVGGRWREPLNLYLATALPSGGGKSPAEKAMTRAVRAWEKERRQQSMTEVSEADVRRRILEKQAKDAESSAASRSKDIGVAIEARRLLDEHVVVHPFRRLVDDATPEKLTQILAEQHGLIAVLSTEAELLDMAAGTYGRSPNINVYLKAYSGDPMMVDRKGGTTNPATELRIDKPLLTVGLAMQPTVIDFIGAQNAQLEGRGFLARFLYSCPEPTTGVRDRSRVLDAPETAAADRYDAELTRLAECWRWPAGDLTLTPAAERRFVAHLQDQEAEMGDRLAPVSAWIAKLQSSILRVAGLLHLADGRTPNEQIDVPTIERAIVAGDYWIAHALAMAADEDRVTVAEATHVLKTIRRRLDDGAPATTAREIYTACRPRYTSVEELVAPLQLLERSGYVRLTAGSWLDVGVRGRTTTFECRPLSEWIDHRERENARVARVAYGEIDQRSIYLSTSIPPSPPAPLDNPRDPRVLGEATTSAQRDPLDWI